MSEWFMQQDFAEIYTSDFFSSKIYVTEVSKFLSPLISFLIQERIYTGRAGNSAMIYRLNRRIRAPQCTTGYQATNRGWSMFWKQHWWVIKKLCGFWVTQTIFHASAQYGFTDLRIMIFLVFDLLGRSSIQSCFELPFCSSWQVVRGVIIRHNN
jgi:hypothetical protein